MSGESVIRDARLPADEGIDVLLVDDNEMWAEFIAGELESHAPELSVTVALRADAAMEAVREDAPECILADYQMPGIDGLELLDRVREERPNLPFILITGAGTEDVASRAINAGVSDYIVKDPGADQASIFTKRIRSAVERYRLQKRLRESERRYRTVTEQSHDAIAIWREDELLFFNRALSELVGYDGADLHGAEFVADLVHPDDRERFRDTVEGWRTDSSSRDLHEVRVVTAGGEARHCEYRGRVIPYGDEPAVLVSIRDVTDRKRREREREWERRLSRGLQRALIEATTREDLEDTVGRLLADEGYDLVWIGEPAGDRLRPRRVYGDAAYVEDTAFPSDATDGDTAGGDTAGDADPSARAARTRDPQFVSDLRERFATAWRDRALDHGFRSCAAVPLVHEGVFYGVVGIYDDEPGAFDGPRREFLAELADTVAFAVHNVENMKALAADTVLEVRVAVDGTGYYLSELVADAGSDVTDPVTVEGTVPHGDDAVVQYLRLDGVDLDGFRDRLDAHPAVTETAVVAADPPRLQLHADRPTPESRLAALGAVVRSTVVGADGVEVAFEVSGRQDVRRVVEDLDARFGSASVLSVVESDRSDPGPGRFGRLDDAELTDKQLTALRAAYHQGYFERPRRQSASEIAESLGVSHTTFLQHLHVAQRKLFGAAFG